MQDRREYQKQYREQNRDILRKKVQISYEENQKLYADKQALIREARIKRGWTQREFAIMCGVTQPKLCLWEQGKLPAKWEKILKYLPELRSMVIGG